jgi:phage baseplate assembly protein W
MPYKSITLRPANTTAINFNKKKQLYKGFSTVNSSNKSSKIYDFDLIKQNLLNQFNVRKGERVMNPNYGTIIWDIIHEPFTDEVKQQISDDVSRILNSDPRAYPIQINVDEQEYGMLLEVTMQYTGTDQVDYIRYLFDENLGLSVE